MNATAGVTTTRQGIGKRLLLAWLLLIGIPAGLEWGGGVRVDTGAGRRHLTYRHRPPFGDASLFPQCAHDRKNYVWEGAQPTFRFTLWPQKSMDVPAVPWPSGEFEITLTLLAEGTPSRETVSWSGKIDAAWHSGMEPYERCEVALDALAGGALEEGDYRLIIEVKDLAGPKAGKTSRNFAEFTVVSPWSPGDGAVADSEGQPTIEIVGFEAKKWSDVMVLRYSNTSGHVVHIYGLLESSGDTAPANDADAAEGDRIAMPARFVSRLPNTPPGAPYWAGVWQTTIPSVGLVSVAPGRSVTLRVFMDHASPGVGYLEGHAKRAVLRTPVMRLTRDDMSTTGPVLLRPRPPGAPRPKWRFEVLESGDGTPEVSAP